MNNKHVGSTSTARRTRTLTLIVGALSSILFGATGGCQGRREQMSQPARIVFDSLIIAREAMYDSAGPTLGYHRGGCLFMRAMSTLGFDTASRIAQEAVNEVRARHSRAEEVAISRGLQGNHPAPTPEGCQRVDSLWYERAAKPPNARRQP